MTDWTNAGHVQDAQVVFRVVSGRWTLPVLAALERGPMRHNELRRTIGSVRPKVLNDTLHRLTDQKLVRREVRAESPPAVYYILAEPARSLLPELGCLLRWANNHPAVFRLWQETTQPPTTS